MSSTIEMNHPRMVALRVALREARELFDKREFAAAKRSLDQLAIDMDALGQTSSVFDLTMGITLDCLDDEERAMAYLEKALAADPLSLDIERAIEVVLGNARRSLTMDALPIESPRIAMLYGLLHRRDQASRASHLVFVRHQLATGQTSEARSLLEAMVRLYYPAADLQELLVQCADKLGDPEAAARARVEVGRLNGPEEAAALASANERVLDRGSSRPRVRPS